MTSETTFSRKYLDDMTYSCAYSRSEEDSLEHAQQKYEYICRKLRLEPGETLWTFGCG